MAGSIGLARVSDSLSDIGQLSNFCSNDILWRLCVDLEPLVAELEKETSERFEVVQVKQKLGPLRFYVSHHTDPIDKRIAEAQEESSRTCEVCGQPGRQRKTGGGVRARCDERAHSPEGQ